MYDEIIGWFTTEDVTGPCEFLVMYDWWNKNWYKIYVTGPCEFLVMYDHREDFYRLQISYRTLWIFSNVWPCDVLANAYNGYRTLWIFSNVWHKTIYYQKHYCYRTLWIFSNVWRHWSYTKSDYRYRTLWIFSNVWH